MSYIGSPAAPTIATVSDGTVTSNKLADDAVTSAKITDGAVTPSDLSTGHPNWDSSGKVGIGTSSPSQKVDVVGNGAPSSAIISMASNETNSNSKYGYYAVKHYTNAEEPLGLIQGESNASNNYVNVGGGNGETNAATLLRFYTAANTSTTVGTNWVTITAAGEFLHNVGGQRGGALSTFGGTYNNPVMSIRQPNTSGTFNIVNFYDGDDNVCGYIGINTSGNTVSYNTSSDYRLKENVIEVTDGIDRVKLLKPSRFNFITDPDTTVDGFLAHEVQDVVPEAIHGTKDQVDKEGDPVYQGIDQSKLVPLLTAALQEAITKIESLETEMITVKSRLDALESA